LAKHLSFEKELSKFLIKFMMLSFALQMPFLVVVSNMRLYLKLKHPKVKRQKEFFRLEEYE
jgi:hypothetical protein